MGTNYKSEYLNKLCDNAEANLYAVDNALQRCLDNYYEACETSNMLGATMKLFVAVEQFSEVIMRNNERDNVWMVRDLIVSGMREREGVCVEHDSDDKLWGDYTDTLRRNMEYEFERICYARREFLEDSEMFTRMFDNL